MTRALRCVAIACIVVLFAARNASAQAVAPTTPSAASQATGTPATGVAPTTDAARSEGEQHYQHGLELYRAGELERALHEFRAAYDLVHIPALLYNVGVAQRQLGDLDGAIQTFEQYIATGGEQIPADRRAEMLELLAQMRRDTVEVRFEVSLPEGVHARLSMDGHALGEGPWTRAYRFTEGEHQARLQADGIPDVVTAVRITRGTAAQVTLRMERPRTTGLLHVALAAGVQGARVRVDDRTSAALPLDVEVEGGAHIVRVTAPGYLESERHLVVGAGERANVDVVLVPIPLPPVYRRWWFVTGAGVVVVAAVVAIVYKALVPQIHGDLATGTWCMEINAMGTPPGCNH